MQSRGFKAPSNPWLATHCCDKLFSPSFCIASLHCVVLNRPVSVEAVLSGSRDSSSVHPAVLALGLRYGDGSITGSTARCVALVHALCQVGGV